MNLRRDQRARALAALVWVSLLPGGVVTAWAQQSVELQDALAPADPAPTDTRTADEYFCDWVEAEADAEAVVLLAPEAYMTGGLTQTSGDGPSDDDLDDSNSSIAPRLISGLRYRFANLRRRNLTYDRARAQCQRYRAHAGLTSILAWGSDMGRRESLEAQRVALIEALDEARAMAAEVEQRVAAREGTVLELYTTSERIDDFSDALSRIELSLRQLDLRPEMPAGATPPELMDSYLAGDHDLLEAEYALNRARTWELELRGEYDWVIGDTSASDGPPVQVTLRATFNFGRFWQPSAQHRALRAREGFLMQEQAELRTRMTRLAGSLNDQLAEEQRRLAELNELAVAIDEQLERAAASDSQLAQELHTRLWFDAAEIRAERMGLEARVEALESFVAGAE